uniref:Uncharacterized protein n=1 Tax=Arundo donax TaxID=35708 RepID=A0A0A9EP32_ARUDO
MDLGRTSIAVLLKSNTRRHGADSRRRSIVLTFGLLKSISDLMLICCFSEIGSSKLFSMLHNVRCRGFDTEVLDLC